MATILRSIHFSEIAPVQDSTDAPSPQPPQSTPAHDAFFRLLASQKEFLGVLLEPLNTYVASRQPTPLRIVAPEDESRANRYLRALAFATDWLAVMVVTAVETYLQDALAYCAELDPGLMEKSEQVATYQEIVASPSTGALAASLRRRWARNFVDRGGPATWIDRLTRMGASSYDAPLASELETLWGIRHVVIHNAGRVTSDFALRHPATGKKPGDYVSLAPEAFGRYLDAAKTFVWHTDEFLVLRFCRPGGAAGKTP